MEGVWRRCGGDVEEMWRRCGGDVGEMWMRELVPHPSSIPAASNAPLPAPPPATPASSAGNEPKK